MPDNERSDDKGLLFRITNHVVLVPLTVMGLLLAGVTYVWTEIKQYHVEQQVSDANEYLEFVTAHLNAQLNVRLVLGELIRQEWQDYQSRMPEDFTAIVKPKIDRFPDIQAINWVDREGVIRWVNPFAGNEQALGVNVRGLAVPSEALREAESTGELRMTAPIDLLQGGRGIVTYIPVLDAGRVQGFINMVFRARDMVDVALPHEKRSDYDIFINDDGEPIYEQAAEGAFAPINTKLVSIANRQWTVGIAPTQRTISDATTPGINLILLLGLVGSVALPLMLYQLMRRHRMMRESEQRFADFADVSSDWFWETDADLRFSYLSSRFEEVTGMPPDRLLGKTRQEVGAPDSDPQRFQSLIEDMSNHLPFREFEHSRVRPDGRKVFLSISGSPTYDDSGEFIGYRGVGRDITERKTSQQVLNDALIASEQANRAKSEFLATMSHEFRTPLNAIIGFSEMLKEEYFGKLGADNYVDYATDIHRSGRHMLDLVNDILDFSAIEAAKRRMNFEEFSLLDVVNDGIRTIENQMWEKNQSLTLDLPDGLPGIYADKRSIYQIILNLLSNAVKFTPEGGVLRVSVRHDDAGFSLSVADTGLGISPDRIATITEPFAQSHTDSHIAGSGTGLGLTIVKSLVESHNGTLSIESEVGVGTTVTFTIPGKKP